jgi:hypothetical protein
MLTEQERQERCPEALQRHMMNLVEMGSNIAEELIDAKSLQFDANKKVGLLDCKAKWIKQEISATQTILKSIKI